MTQQEFLSQIPANMVEDYKISFFNTCQVDEWCQFTDNHAVIKLASVDKIVDKKDKIEIHVNSSTVQLQKDFHFFLIVAR